MESSVRDVKITCKLGDRSTSDVVVRLRTQDGRDDWLYCHTKILTEKCKYFADRLSDNWPTCQIIDSRSCVDVFCQESDFDYHVNLIRLLYVVIDGSVDDLWHGVRNALGILQVAVELGCPEIITACVNYIEAVAWEESEEDEILKIVPRLGLQAEPILARLQPVNQSAIICIFVSAIRFATSSPPPSLNDLKSSAQEQLEYMLTEDDDAPLLTADDNIKYEVKECVNKLFARFNNSLAILLCDSTESLSEARNIQLFQSYLTDLSWACQILNKLEIMREFVESWFDASEKIVKVLELGILAVEIIEVKLRAIEVASKVLEAIGYGTVILPTAKRLEIVKVWLPFVRITKPMIDSVTMNSDNALALKFDGELWQSLESTFVSIILALPSGDQAEVLTEWLANDYVRYPDLTEAFEVWCYRSKVAKRRLLLLGDDHGTSNSA
ncbi:BTB/POZ domain-containing protein At3g05675-like [Neltuma alba]|uniref:BTB/POZ domain-containing protein At3g05675-like n=1 Tax=Neltuma alba TaxID=207710 RepID=UPI0010A52B9A|nr:BTB/POZ domain-containing protein At3g05675-like [Prosopis alba]XP_028784936.1 BTB/POZ domain-containing protein At3g05675-like [Prosopis alba]XP_028784937.1 BTB/POZ domain-containing protein At3g05675-like [Prosopis alba]XP_028787724.1 BTB/POZ domain-containing protein At3g05675-like [Prosopis alba]XP_028787725.1 BTB/POZ domain-containing protein At3g05675-like [Prosopis alba]XP_028787726.1 BTB/POZ domain-containing protein At3g05675-like [Prosopis alba]